MALDLQTGDLGAGLDPIERLSRLLAPDLARVEALLAERAASPVAIIPDVARHLIGAGGKRLRPLVTLAAARSIAETDSAGEAACKLAAAVEFIHTATLLHDDVVDDSDLRRGRPAARNIWGNSASILVGDFLFAGAFQLMVETGEMAVLDILSRASGVISEGEVRQLAAMAARDRSRETYLAVVEAKTAALFEAAARAGAVSAGGTGDAADALAEYGRSLGLAFQIVDDALDYGGATLTIGKSVGDDFREGKLTLPAIIAIERADPVEAAFWADVLSPDAVRDDAALDRALACLKRTGALEESLRAARAYGEAAKAALDDVADSAVRDGLLALVDFALKRAH